jgi:ornithine carbamoyltransferase
MDLLRIEDLNKTQILDIFSLTDKLKKSNRSNILRGKDFVLFFPESSLRTRISVEKGIKNLGGNCVLFPPETLDKKESLYDVGKYIENWAEGIIVRHPDLSKLEQLSKDTAIPVINAMTTENHPCEIITDLYSISKLKKDYQELVYTFVGVANNISRSWMNIARVMDLKLNHVCVNGNRFTPDNDNYSFTTDLENTLYCSDIVLTDSLPDKYSNQEYIKKYQITLKRMGLANKNALLNPCPPFFRGEEVSKDVIASDYFVGHLFKKNLIYVQQAIIAYCLGLSI